MYNIIRMLVLATGISGIGNLVYAQDKTQGQIHYELTFNLHASMKPDQLQYKDLVPETLVDKAELIYKGQHLKSFFPDEIDKEEDGHKTSIRVATEEGSERYADIENKKIWWVDRKKNPPVLVEKELAANEEEKMQETTETRKILDYTCKKLLLKTKKNGTVAIWYTTELPLKAGSPFGSITDKGVVLAMESKRASFKAIGIDFTAVDEKDVMPPAEMKIVKTQDQSAK
jgi:GLPGLI family protein